MGRPPIGKRAMTATERQRRWRAKSRANKPAARTVSRGLPARVRALEADHAVLCAALGKLLHAMAQRRAGRSKRAQPVFEASFREFQAELARLQRRPDPASLPEKANRQLDNGLDGRKLVVTVTGYRRPMIWLSDPTSNEVIGPLVLARTRNARGRAKAPAVNHAKARRGRVSKAGGH